MHYPEGPRSVMRVFLADRSQGGAEVYRGGGFPNAALLICKNQNSHYSRPRIRNLYRCLFFMPHLYFHDATVGDVRWEEISD